MLEPLYLGDAETFLENDHYIVWKFPASDAAYEKQARPLILSYSIMTRAYGTRFNVDDMIGHFNHEGFDVFLVDWGKTGPFTLAGWTLDDLVDRLETEVIDGLLAAYNVPNLNVFAICIGGAVLTYLLAKRGEEAGKKLHRIGYYAVPIIGARDLGMEKTFLSFFRMMKPWAPMLKQTGISLFFLDLLILYSGSLSMLQWTWSEYFKENKDNSVFNILAWTFDDRLVPFPAMMDVIENGFHAAQHPTDFHFEPGTENIHFLNIVGDDDMLVKPSASIIEWNSTIPGRYRSFKQMILNTDHFLFARPGFTAEKREIARWFSGYSLESMLHKLKTDKGEKFTERAGEVFRERLRDGYEKADRVERSILIRRLNEILENDPAVSDLETLADQLAEMGRREENAVPFEALEKEIVPIAEKSNHRKGNAGFRA